MGRLQLGRLHRRRFGWFCLREWNGHVWFQGGFQLADPNGFQRQLCRHFRAQATHGDSTVHQLARDARFVEPLELPLV